MSSFWSDVYSAEMKNVQTCVIDRKTQLLTRSKKLVVMDMELCRLFSIECSTNLIERSIVYQLCHEFIKTSRALRYSPVHLKSIPVSIKDIFTFDSQ